MTKDMSDSYADSARDGAKRNILSEEGQKHGGHLTIQQPVEATIVRELVEAVGTAVVGPMMEIEKTKATQETRREEMRTGLSKHYLWVATGFGGCILGFSVTALIMGHQDIASNVVFGLIGLVSGFIGGFGIGKASKADS